MLDRAARDRGAATAELAVVLPALVLLAVAGLWTVLVGAAQLRAVDAAGVGARALARGEPAQQVRRVVSQVAPAGARVRLGRDGRFVVVEVRAAVALPLWWPGGSGSAVTVGDRAVAVAEDVAAPLGSGP